MPSLDFLFVCLKVCFEHDPKGSMDINKKNRDINRNFNLNFRKCFIQLSCRVQKMYFILINRSQLRTGRQYLIIIITPFEYRTTHLHLVIQNIQSIAQYICFKFNNVMDEGREQTSSNYSIDPSSVVYNNFTKQELHEYRPAQLV